MTRRCRDSTTMVTYEEERYLLSLEYLHNSGLRLLRVVHSLVLQKH